MILCYSFPSFYYKNLFFCFLITINLSHFTINGISQDSLIHPLPDTINTKLEQLNSAIGKADYLLNIIEDTPIEHNKLITALAQTCFQISKEHDLQIIEAKSTFWKIASMYENQAYSVDNLLNIGELNKILYLFEQAELPLWEARTKMVLSNTYYYLDKDSLGLKISDNLLKQLKNLNNRDYPLLFGDTYKNRGNLFYLIGDLDSIIFNYEKAYTYYLLDSIRLKNKLVDLNVNLAIANFYSKNYKRSNDYCNEALILCSKNDSISLSRVYVDCAHILAEQGLEEEKVELFNTSNKSLEKALDYNTSQLSRTYYQLGANTQNIAIYSDKLDSITYDSLFKKAAFFYLKAITSGTKEGNQDVYENVFNAAVKLTENEIEKNGEVNGGKIIISSIKNAYLTTYKKADTLNQKQIQLNTELNELKLDTEKRKRNKSLLLFSLIAVGILGIITAIYLWQRNKTIRQNFEIRLEALRSQINSHFISNTLNAIDLLIMEGKKGDASRYIVDLHRLVRTILDSSKKNLVSLDREIDILRRYLKLEQLRLGDRVQVKWDIDERIKLEDHKVPPLVLQPFVENAIWHGILNKDHNESGTVQIGIQDQGELLACTIRDDGVGRKRARELKAEATVEFQSLGMKITNERIEALKKIKDAGVETIDLYHENGESAGTKIVIRLPKQN